MSKKYKLCKILICTIISMTIYINLNVNTEKCYAQDYDFSDVQGVLDDSEENINFKETVTDIASGESDTILRTMLTSLKDKLFHEFTYNKIAIAEIIALAIAAALFTNFAGIFASGQISEMGFYVTYLLIISVLVGAFSVISSIASDVITMLLDFMKALIPSYFLSVGLAGGTSSAIGFYEISLGMITVVNVLFCKILIPAVNIYVVLILVNNISEEDFLSRFAELIKTFMDWALKTILTVVLSINVIQGMVLPAADSVKISAFQKVASAIPGVGGGVNAVTGVIAGSANIIKNAIGAAALIGIIVCCFVPLAKIAAFSLMYQGTAAIVQPVADKRIVECIGGVAAGARLLLKMVFISAVLFVITIAIVCLTVR